jgi:hypothetical protein
MMYVEPADAGLAALFPECRLCLTPQGSAYRAEDLDRNTVTQSLQAWCQYLRDSLVARVAGAEDPSSTDHKRQAAVMRCIMTIDLHGVELKLTRIQD